MESHIIVNTVIFLAVFFALTSTLQIFSKKTAFPYTVSLLVAGFLAQLFFHFYHIDAHLSLDPNTIYYLLLPLLLFEAAIHINIHQFRLQFWTITFMSTFGLIVSLLIVGFGMHYFLGFPLGMSMLFGALISATDPIAVLALFKSLGAPKRLALLADGESMFNDATAVLAFKVVAGFVFASSYFQSKTLFISSGHFLFVFFGSIILGTILGFISSEIIRRVKNNYIVENSITITLAVGSFILSDHFLGLSGVITTVMAGIVFGNLGKTRISQGVRHFVNDTWEYIAFVAVSLVFFFASFQLQISSIIKHLNIIPFIILIVLIARAISVYLSFYISNKAKIFQNEPDVPLSWQHILNWGGLRGVIPLVLAYSIPNDYIYKEEIISFTLATFVFTLLVNALTIRPLLIMLGLHLPKQEEEIIKEESELFNLEQKKLLLKDLPQREFYKDIVKNADEKLASLEQKHMDKLLLLANYEELKNSLMLQAIDIARKRLIRSFHRGYISEGVVYEYESQLDLQEDALEYPEVYSGRGYTKGGRLPQQRLFRTRLKAARDFFRNLWPFNILFGLQEEDVILERLMQLKTKIIVACDVLDYLERVEKVFEGKTEGIKAIKEVREEYEKRKKEYEESVEEIKKSYPTYVKRYQQNLIENIVSI